MPKGLLYRLKIFGMSLEFFSKDVIGSLESIFF